MRLAASIRCNPRNPFLRHLIRTGFERCERRPPLLLTEFWVQPRIVGSVLNGLGSASSATALLAPRLDVFRRYFPAMDGQRFNFIFNRYAYVSLTQKPTPDTVKQVLIEVPEEVFKPVRNVRRLVSGQPPQKGCSQPTAGGVGKLSTQANTLTIEGWAPWKERG